MVGVNVPIVPMAHQYAITRPAGTIPSDLPTMRDPDRLVYFREEVGGLIVGGYERNPDPWCLDGNIPPTFNNTLLSPDWDRFMPIALAGQEVVPALVDADVVQLINGPEAFTPDGEFILGESDVAGFFVAAGFCAHGIAGAGGVGKVMAEWIVGREPPMDLWKMDVRRFGPQYASRGYCLARTDEVYSTYYDIVFPNHERQAGRPLRTPAAYTAAPRARRRARREERMGAGQLVPLERGRRPRAVPPVGLVGRALVDRDRHRAPRDAQHGRALRRVELRQDRGERSGCGSVPRVDVRQQASPGPSARSRTRRC